MAEQKKYYIRVPEALVEVSKEQYAEYHKVERHLLTLIEKDGRHGLISFSDLDTRQLSAEEVLLDQNTDLLEEQVITKLMAAKVKRCVEMLPKQERDLIHAIYYDGMSERQLSRKTGIPNTTIESRKRTILNKLKRMMEE